MYHVGRKRQPIWAAAYTKHSLTATEKVHGIAACSKHQWQQWQQNYHCSFGGWMTIDNAERTGHSNCRNAPHDVAKNIPEHCISKASSSSTRDFCTEVYNINLTRRQNWSKRSVLDPFSAQSLGIAILNWSTGLLAIFQGFLACYLERLPCKLLHKPIRS